MATSKTFVALSVICLGAIVAAWLFNIDVVTGQLGDNPDWMVVLAPRPYFLGLYAFELCAIIGALWFWLKGRKETPKATDQGKRPHQ
jgi:hypothetical protein